MGKKQAHSINNSFSQKALKALEPGSVLPANLSQHLLECAPDAIIIADGQGRIILLNSQAEQLFGYKLEEVQNQTIERLLPRQCKDECLSNESSDDPLAILRHAQSYCLIGLRKSGLEVPIEISVSQLTSGSQIFYTAILRDVTERKRVQQDLEALTIELQAANSRLQEIADIDPLTQVFNRRGLQHCLSQTAELARREGLKMTAALIDLDDFKSVNDSKGHAIGDLVLTGVVERIKSALRSSDILARAGGDEFIVIMPSTGLSEGAQVAERMRSRVSNTPLKIADELFEITISCGVVSVPSNISATEDVLTLAKSSLKTSKAYGKNCVSIGDTQTARVFTQTSLPADIHALINTSCLRAVAQPIFALLPEVPEAYELFTRGPHGALEMPADLFAFALKHDFIERLDLCCLQNCLLEGEKLNPDVPLHLNVFPSTLINTPPEIMRTLFTQCAGKIRNVCLEVNEQHFTFAATQLQKPLSKLRSSQVKLVIDGISFGRSSLEALILLEPEMVKIDGQYVTGLAQDLRRQKALARLLKVTTTLGIKVIAAGIETEEDLAMVKRLGIMHGQGLLLAPPEPASHLRCTASQMTKLNRKRTHTDRTNCMI